MHYKYLNLILYSEIKDDDNTIYYKQMKNILTKYLETLKNIKFYFFRYDKNLETDYTINENEHLILIKGTETSIPGVIQKTIKSIEITKNIEYDYFIRSNISTIINFNVLDNSIKEASYEKKVSICSYFKNENLNIDYESILYVFFEWFVCLQKNLVLKLLTQDFYHKFYEDIEFSFFLNKVYTPEPENILLKLNILSRSINTSYGKNILCYRNKSFDRKNDVLIMNDVVNSLIYNVSDIFCVKNEKIQYIDDIIHFDDIKILFCYAHDLLNKINISKLSNIKNKFILVCYGNIYILTKILLNNLLKINNLQHIFTDNIYSEIIHPSITLIPTQLKQKHKELLTKNLYINNKKTKLLHINKNKKDIFEYKYSLCSNLYDIWFCIYTKTIPIVLKNNENGFPKYLGNHVPILFLNNISNIDEELEYIYNKINIWNNDNILYLTHIKQLFYIYLQ